MSKCESDALFERFVESWRLDPYTMNDQQLQDEAAMQDELIRYDPSLFRKAKHEAARRGLS